jgi:choice-of-anchor C domain-containing protein
MIKTKVRALCMAALLFSAIAITHAASIIVDGSFETPDVSGEPNGFKNVQAGSNFIAPWVVTLDSIDVLNVNNAFLNGAAADGVQYVDLNGNNAGQLTQTFSTTAGTLYQFSFDYADNYLGPPPNSPRSAEVRVYDSSGNIFPLTSFTHSTSVSGNLDWTLFSGFFLATDTMASIEFTSLNPDSGSGVLLDNVMVFEAIPEMSSMVPAILICGALVIHALRRRGRAAAWHWHPANVHGL